MMSDYESLARFLSSDMPGDFDRMPAAQQDYWRRMSGRAFVWLRRKEQAEAEMMAVVETEADAA